ncbi:MAG: hypothetical protein K5777_05010 [Nitrosopumilus sp.]|nr:hypothetical protein [Nitrosopumilus sp.]
MSKKRNASFSKRKLNAINEDPLWIIVRKFVKTEMRPILNEIKSRKESDEIRIYLMNYLIVRIISIFENYLLNSALRIFKSYQIDTSKILKNINSEVPLEQQIISSYSFMNLKDINILFSHIINKRFFDEIKYESETGGGFSYDDDVHIPYASPLHKNWKKFEKMFELRDGIIHHNKLIKMKWREFRDSLESVIDFLICTSVILPV